jgi:ABC-type Na+ efflux pump permease subunit
MNNIITTIKKELRSILRDKKTIAVFFVYPIMIPVMIMLYGTMYDNLENEETQYTIGINYQISDNEKAILEELNLEYKFYNTQEELEESYKNDEISAYIEYDNQNNNYEIN